MAYVIVGNGVASVGAIEGIRKVDRSGDIVVISDESTPTYGRPLISYFLAGKVKLDNMGLRPDDFYEKNNVTLKLGSRVVGLDTQAKQLATSTNEKIKYDQLLIATGGTPFMPALKGIEGSGVYNFTTLGHAQQLLGIVPDVRKVVVIGGGLIGLKAAEGLFDNGLSVTIAELAPRVLSAAFDDVAGGLVSRKLQQVGIDIRCGVSAQEILRDENGAVTGVALSNGEEIPCDAVVVAIGVVPCIEPAEGAGVAVGRGIKVDDYLCSSVPDVYAAGDVAEAYDIIADESRVTPIWPNAYSQGFYAGLNMAGKKDPHPGGLAMNSIAFYGLATASLGLVNPTENDECEVFTEVDEEAQNYRKLVFRDNVLIGYVLVGDIDFAGLYTGFVKFQLPLDDEKKQALKDGEPSALLWPADDYTAHWESE